MTRQELRDALCALREDAATHYRDQTARELEREIVWSWLPESRRKVFDGVRHISTSIDRWGDPALFYPLAEKQGIPCYLDPGEGFYCLMQLLTRQTVKPWAIASLEWNPKARYAGVTLHETNENGGYDATVHSSARAGGSYIMGVLAAAVLDAVWAAQDARAKAAADGA